MRCLVFLALFACSKWEPTPETQEEQDEATVITYEEMAKLVGENPTCERWAAENGRRWGARRLQMMIDRIQKFDEARQQAFRTKYGTRIDAAAAIVAPFAEGCIEYARNKAIEQIEIVPRGK